MMTCRTLEISGFSLQQLAKDKSTVVHVRQMINNEQKSKILCRVCKSKAKLTGLLYRCESSSCGAVHWDKGKVKKLKQKFVENEALLLSVLSEAKVPTSPTSNKTNYVYLLRLRGQLNAVYVGMTGLHPYHRYLNHIRGYKASRHTKKNATALIRFEGPMAYNAAVEREQKLALELRLEGYKVYGGH